VTLHLSILLWVPAAFGLLALLLPGRATARAAALAGTAIALAYAIFYVVDFDTGARGLQYVTDETWIAELGIHYKLGLDGLNLFLILLTAALWFAVTLWSVLGERREREGNYFFHLLLGESAVLGALLSQDLGLFVAFFDLMLIPFFFLTGIWGRGTPGERARAVTKLVIYTLVGSLLMLAAAIALAVLSAQETGGDLSFVLSDLAQIRLPEGTQQWIFLCFAAAFLVKMPAFPLHGWMPDGYGTMPLPVLAVFSGVLSKVAAYGFLRIVTPLLPDASVHFQELMLLIALASILYGSAMAFTTTSTRLILGYSSVAQLGFILLGIFALNERGAQGAVLQSINHGLVVAPAFFVVALLGARAGGSEDVRDMGGIALRAPVLATMFLIVALANLAMPGSSNFAGEFLILLGVFEAKIVIAIVAFTGVVLASVYSLRLFVRAMHNRVGAGVASRDLTVRDGLVLVPLVVAIIGLALYPQLPLEKGERAVTDSVRAAGQVAAPAPTAQQAPAPEAP
jgi:NADH-quinone oxidoreductase subunit M